MAEVIAGTEDRGTAVRVDRFDKAVDDADELSGEPADAIDDGALGHVHHIGVGQEVTFGPDGITGHSDHRAVSRWTTDARAAALHGRPVVRHTHRRLSSPVGRGEGADRSVGRTARSPGTIARRSRTVATDDILRFTEMTGDRNPIGTIRTTITDQRGTVVLNGTAVVYRETLAS